MAAKEILAQAIAIAKQQAVLNSKGKVVATPNIKVFQVLDKNGDSALEIKAGQFYRKGNDDVYIGVQAKFGSSGRDTVLYPVDRSDIPTGFTITYVPLGEGD